MKTPLENWNSIISNINDENTSTKLNSISVILLMIRRLQN